MPGGDVGILENIQNREAQLVVVSCSLSREGGGGSQRQSTTQYLHSNQHLMHQFCQLMIFYVICA